MIDVLSIIVGGGVFAALSALVQFFFNRHDRKKEKNSEVMKAIKSVSDKLDAHIEAEEIANLKQIRIHIIRLADDITHGREVSDEMLDNGMDDVTAYEEGCKNHPTFKNSKAMVSIGVVKKAFASPRKGDNV